MSKILFLLLCSAILLMANSIKFKEEKYINALQTSIHKNGIVNFEKDCVELHYPEENKTFVLYPDYIVLKTQKKEEILKYEQNIGLSVFLTLIKSIYTNESESLKSYFEIHREKEKTILVPNEYFASVIQKIEFTKNNDKLEFLTIYFVNEDWIKIVQIN